MSNKGHYLIDRETEIEIGNPFLTLEVSTSKGLQPRTLRSPVNDFTYGNMPYLYRLEGRWEIPTFLGYKKGGKEGRLQVIFEGRLNDLKLLHRFDIPSSEPYIDENLILKNETSGPIGSSRMAMGFARSVGTGGRIDEDLRACHMVSVPFMLDLRGRRAEYKDYSFRELLINRGTYCPRWPRTENTPEMGSEGWVWTCEGSSFLIAKHSPKTMEFSVLSTFKKGRRNVLRFGGASLWHGDPEEGTEIPPKSSIAFSTTRYTLVDGGIREAYYVFRNYMELCGHGVPNAFDPPVHWNELYDNPLWWGEDTFRKREELYTLAHMEEEAAKAREIGCESLYLDPGWDTSFGSSIWPPYRLLEAREFVELMDHKYGLKVSLHMPLAVWCDATAYPLEAHRRDKDGKILPTLCSASPAYLKTKRKRLLELAKAGFVYYMFDGTAFTGDCWDPSHGHSLPLKRSEHCKSILGLAQAVHREHPDIIIELHDPILGGVPERYAPMHYLHGLKGSFDEGWGFEYMWDPMEDLISGRAISLYYYNLAYSLPLYLHIDLRKDNSNALEFWWYASTCRHLGIGGKHEDPKVWDAHKRAMRTYVQLKRFYTQGIFLGLDEEIHLHFIPGENRAVLNAFNLKSKAILREITIDISEIGLKDVKAVSQGEWSVKGSELSLRLSLEPRDAKIVEIVSSNS